MEEGRNGIPFYVSLPTLKLLKIALSAGKSALRNMGETKRNAAADDDKWHDETFRDIEREMAVLASRLAGIAPGLSLNAINLGEGIEVYHPNDNNNVVSLGSKVTLRRYPGPETTQYVIVGRLDLLLRGDGKDNWTTVSSPVGRALLGKTKGDRISVMTPEGSVELVIEEVSPATELESELP